MGSLAIKKTTGMVCVAALATSVALPPIATITVTWRRTRSAASAGSRPLSPSAARGSMVTLRPTTYRVSARPWANTPKPGNPAFLDTLVSHPITGTSACCASAATGQAAALLSPAMNSRRRIP